MPVNSPFLGFRATAALLLQSVEQVLPIYTVAIVMLMRTQTQHLLQAVVSYGFMYSPFSTVGVMSSAGPFDTKPAELWTNTFPIEASKIWVSYTRTTLRAVVRGSTLPVDHVPCDTQFLCRSNSFNTEMICSTLHKQYTDTYPTTKLSQWFDTAHPRQVSVAGDVTAAIWNGKSGMGKPDVRGYQTVGIKQFCSYCYTQI